MGGRGGAGFGGWNPPVPGHGVRTTRPGGHGDSDGTSHAQPGVRVTARGAPATHPEDPTDPLRAPGRPSHAPRPAAPRAWLTPPAAREDPRPESLRCWEVAGRGWAVLWLGGGALGRPRSWRAAGLETPPPPSCAPRAPTSKLHGILSEELAVGP
ncbi:uncharacterized protein LOC117071302 [Trachypithecus francoisi]|uniref:uncharacterized protein LOC117071302 n=1 Tax=Trachypithecus francoisi TaxID=54180 RepID=UPI00141BCC9E|nr:uncharacterized protein LOC117071302 [Trachypithecus francoisi]